MGHPTPSPSLPGHAPRSAGTLLRLTGADALALVHRLATRSLDDLPAGGARMTMFCDFRGRVLHRVAVARGHDDAVWIARDDAPADEMIAFLDRHVFRDDVRIEDALGPRTVRLVLGPGGPAAETLVEDGGAPVRLQVEDAAAYDLAPADTHGSDAADEAARIRAAWPRHGHEVEPSFTPFEIGRAHEVHLSKGCYTGQEALLRLMTYDSVRRALVRVAGHGSAPAVPADMTRDGAVAGRLTSTVADGDGWIGLAVVRRDALASGDALEAGGTAITSRDTVPETRPAGLP